ncbi:unnamed protein product [Citrullus colocynthis]|uniref:Uncharacterized protein n=1 Tax=Citrullus colocynthis TaxID=252529 RepID=A0ABP0Z5T8_9ROSI
MAVAGAINSLTFLLPNHFPSSLFHHRPLLSSLSSSIPPPLHQKKKALETSERFRSLSLQIATNGGGGGLDLRFRSGDTRYSRHCSTGSGPGTDRGSGLLYDAAEHV